MTAAQRETLENALIVCKRKHLDAQARLDNEDNGLIRAHLLDEVDHWTQARDGLENLLTEVTY